jgi:hypothetical protein
MLPVAAIMETLLQNIKEQFIDPESGYDCYIVQNPLGLHYCGYVWVPSDHPCFGKDFSELEDIPVHGGVTYAESYLGGWLIGFDCAHFSDYIPGYDVGDPKNFKEIPYVKNQVNNLARELQARGAVKIQDTLDLAISDESQSD